MCLQLVILRLLYNTRTQGKHMTHCMCVLFSGIGAYKFFVLTLRHTIRHGGPPAHMFVSDNKGRMLHVSNGLATMLGSTPKELLSMGCQGAVENLMVQPFTQLHHKMQHVRTLVYEHWFYNYCALSGDLVI